MSVCQKQSMSEDAAAATRNFYNHWNTAIEAPSVSVSKRKQFLARKIRKLKKLLKLRSKASYHAQNHQHLSLEERQNAENELEQRQNRQNHELERKFLTAFDRYDEYECEQNAVNENWENWDGCYLCSGQTTTPSHCGSELQSRWQPEPSSICYVFMPGQAEPVPVKLRTARIPGGVMWISYRPDVDIYAGGNYSCASYTTSSQIAQAQRPIVV